MTENMKLKIGMTLLIVFLFCCASLVQAAVPDQTNWQGRLTDDVGMPLDGTYTMHFYLYDALTGGASLWDEQQSVEVTDGIYNVQLGSVSPLGSNVFSVGEVYLEVVIYNADTTNWETLSPRQRLTSTAYAFQAENAQFLEGHESAEFAPEVHQHSGGDITHGVVDETRIDSDIARDSEISWSNLSGIPSDIFDGDQVGITTEKDPTITEPSIKDGVSWGELSGIPTGFADGVDNNSGGTITGVFGGTGLSGSGTSGPVTLNVEVPLSLSGFDNSNSIISGINTGNGYGVKGEGSLAGVRGTSTITGNVWNWGGYFDNLSTVFGVGVRGATYSERGYGVEGLAMNSGNYTNYGGYFEARGTTGRGVYGKATGGDGYGVYGYSVSSNGVHGEAASAGGAGVYGKATTAGPLSGYGVYGQAAGVHGVGVYGEATNTAEDYNYGAYFVARGTEGYGVYGWSAGSDGIGVYAEAVGANAKAVYGYAYNNGDVHNYGGYFDALGRYADAVYAKATGTSGYAINALSTQSYAGYFTGDVHVAGTLTASNKAFIQPHPIDPSKEIVYVTLEGGENGVYVRGSGQLVGGKAEIDLPEHFALVAAEKGITVQVTPLDDCRGLFITSKNRKKIAVRECQGGMTDARFDYLVMGVRRGFEEHQVIQENKHVKPNNKMSQEEYEEWLALPKNSAMQKLMIENGTLTPEGKISIETAERLGWELGPETKAEQTGRVSHQRPKSEDKNE